MDDAEKGWLRQRLEHFLKRVLSHVPRVVGVVIATLWRRWLTTPEDSSASAEGGPTVESMAREAAETAGFAVTPGAKSDTVFEPEPADTPQPVTETEMRGRREMLEVFRADSEA